MNKTSTVPPLKVDEALFQAMPEALKALDKQARKELRQVARKQFNQARPRHAAS